MTIENRKEREKEFRRQSIIQAAEKVFSVKGFESTTMDDIALEAEFTKRTVYSYYPSKGELYAAVILKAMKLLVSLFEKAASESKDGYERVFKIGETYTGFSQNYPLEFKILTFRKPSLSEAPDSPCVAEVFEENKNMMKLIIRCFEEGVKDGSIRGDIDPVRSALYVVSVTTGMLELLSQSGNTLGKAFGVEAEEFVSYSLKMIGNSFKNNA